MSEQTINLLGKTFVFDLHGVIHVSCNGSYGGAIEFDGGFGPATAERVESAYQNSLRYFGGKSKIKYQDRVSLRAGLFKLFNIPDPMLTGRNAESDYAELRRKYPFKPLSKKFLREREDVCDTCNGDPDEVEECVWCDGEGTNNHRAVWCNATEVYEAEVDGMYVLLMVFDGQSYGSDRWFIVNVNTKPYQQDPKTLRSPRALVSASSTRWDGGRAGSGIYRAPITLRGFLYRSCLEEKDDAYVLPADIVDHCLEMAGWELASKN